MAFTIKVNGTEYRVDVDGDTPLLSPVTLQRLRDLQSGSDTAATLITTKIEDPAGYGRVILDGEGYVTAIVEEKAAAPQQKSIRLINSGIYCFDTRKLFAALRHVKPVNEQGEYYLTDVAEILKGNNEPVDVYLHHDAREVYGINTRAELAEFENLFRRGTIRSLMVESGVTFIDPSHAYISADARIGRDCVIYPGVSIEGRSIIGENCEIRNGSRISNSIIGDNVVIKDHSLIIESEIGSDCSVGPFAHLRMNAKLEDKATVGNFVEVKKSVLGRETKAMHLSYLGDATIGAKTNIGAGTITCNYDGVRKNETIIEDNVKIGSDTMLVAPVRVGAGSVTGAGSVVTKDVPPNSLVAGVPAEVKKKKLK